MNKEHAIVDSMVDIITTYLEESVETPDKEKACIYVQCMTLFDGILDAVTGNVFDWSEVKYATQKLITGAANVVGYLQYQTEETKVFSKFIQKCVECDVSMAVSEQINNFFYSIISISDTEPPRYDVFMLSLSKFIDNSSTRFLFINSGALRLIWRAFINSPNDILPKCALNQIILNMEYDTKDVYRQEVPKLFDVMNKELSLIKPDQLIIFITFIRALLIKFHEVYLPIFIRTGCYESLTEYIIINKSIEVLSNISIDGTIHTRLDQLLKLCFTIASDPRSSHSLKAQALDRILLFVKCSRQVLHHIDSNDIINEINSLEKNDYESIDKLMEITAILESIGLSFEPIIPFFFKLCTKDYFMNAQLHPMLSVFIHFEDAFKNYTNKFFGNFLSTLDFNDFSQIIDKYSEIQALLNPIFRNLPYDTRLKLLILYSQSLPVIKNQQIIIKFLGMIISQKGGMELVGAVIEALQLIPESCTLFAQACAESASNSLQFRVESRSKKHPQHFLELCSKGVIKSVHALNFASAVAGRVYNEKYDKEISPKILETNSSPDDLRCCAMGVEIGEDFKDGVLVFPSLIPFASSMTLKNKRDLFLAAFSIESFLEKSQKPLEMFPSIVDIAANFIKPSHALMVCRDPALLLESTKRASNVSSFEFFTFENDFSIVHGSEIKSMSFWMRFSQPFIRQTSLASFCGIHLSLIDNSMYANNNVVAKLPTDEWISVCTIFDDKETHLYLNGSFISKVKGGPSDTTSFGDAMSCMRWQIGGFIRFFKAKPQPLKIFKAGVLDSNNQGEFIKISSSSFLSESFEIVKPSVIMGNPQVAPSYSIIDFINGPYGGSNAIFEWIVSHLESSSIEYIRALLGVLCVLQRRGVSKITRDEYALWMSMMFSFCPEAFDSSSVALIANSLVFSGKFDWSAFLIFACDFSLMISPLAPQLISCFLECISKFPITDSGLNSYLSTQMLYLAALPDAKDEIRELALDISRKLKPASKYPSLLLAAYPDFAEKLEFTETFYEFKESPIVNAFVDAYESSNKSQFLDYHVLTSLPSHNAVHVMKWVIKNKLKYQPLMLLMSCAEHLNYKETWDVILSIVSNGKINESESDFNIQNVDHNLLPEFMRDIMYLLMAVSYLPHDHFFCNLALKLLSNLSLILSSQRDIFFNQEILFILHQIISVGTLFDEVSLFAPSPKITDPDDAIHAAQTRGQNFPPGVGEKFDTPTINYIPSISDTENILKKIEEIIPERFFFGDTASIALSPLPHGLKPEELVAKNLAAQSKTFSDTWNDAIESTQKKFGVFEKSSEAAEKHPVTYAVFRLIGDVVASHPKLVEDIVSLPSIVNARHCLTATQQICFEMLKKSSNFEVVDFVCSRALEGWFTNLLLPLVSVLIDAMKSFKETKYPQSFVRLIVLSLELIPLEKLPALVETLVMGEDIVCSPSFTSDFDTVVMFLYESTTLESVLPHSFHQLYKRFIESSLKCDTVLSQFKKNRIDFAIIGPTIIDDLEMPDFKNKLKFLVTFILRVHTSNLISKLRNNMLQRSNRTVSFLEQADHLIVERSQRLSINRAIGSSLREIARKIFLIFNCCFLRVREIATCRIIRPFVRKGSRLSLTLLSDPLFPARRLQETPLRYVTPEFPDGLVEHIYDVTLGDVKHISTLPKCVMDCLYACPNVSSDVAVHSVGSAHTMFALSANLDNWEQYIVMRLSINGGRPFLSRANCAFLYGVDPLPGCVFLSEGSLHYVEGLRINLDGIIWNHSTDNMLSQHFYRDLMLSGSFGKCSTYQGHCMIEWPTSEILTAIEHFWIHRPYTISLTFMRGFTFNLILHRQHFSTLFPLIQRAVSENVENLPIIENFVRSPAVSARLAQLKPLEVVAMWEKGLLENYTFLALLNYFGRRSYSDYSQYFVFPWIIGDYSSQTLESAPQESFRDLSLPMGQIGVDRALTFDSVYEDSEEPHYFYGTHYMHVGVVLYFMFRLDPFCFFSAQLHKGWDHPNRLFYSMSDTWASAAIQAPSDLKELIPQIYSVPEVLLNVGGLPLTINQEGTDVSNVYLPPWAPTPREFSIQTTQILGSQKVSNTLNKWVDLIFGVKSRGKEAFVAKNIFHPLCYQRDLGEIKNEDPALKRANEVCIINFGQCAYQILNKPCPQQKVPFGWPILNSKSLGQLVKWTQPPPTSLYIDETNISGVGGISCHMAAGWFAQIRDSRLYFVKDAYEIKAGIMPIKRVCTVSASVDGLYIAISCFDGFTILFQILYKKGEPTSAVEIGRYMTAQGHNVAAISSAHFVSATAVGRKVYFYDIGLQEVSSKMELEYPVLHVSFDDAAALFYTAGGLQISVFSVSGEPLLEAFLPAVTTAMAVPPIPESFKGRFVCVGSDDGFVRLLSPDFSEGQLKEILAVNLLRMPVVALGVGARGQKAVAASRNAVCVLDCGSGKALDKKFAFVCSNCGTVLGDKSESCSKCHRFHCQQCSCGCENN